jgi:hypothetical protein
VTFRLIPGFPGYAAGDDGSIWSSRHGRWKSLRQYVSGGYPSVSLYGEDGKQRKLRTSYYTIRAFHGLPANGMVCRHLDGQKWNGRPENLAWGTMSENSRDITFHEGNLKRLTVDQVRDCRRMYAEGLPIETIAGRVGCNSAAVTATAVGIRYGYVPNEDGSKYIPVPFRVPRVDVSLVTRAVELVKGGHSMRSAARALGLAKDSVTRAISGRKPRMTG